MKKRKFLLLMAFLSVSLVSCAGTGTNSGDTTEATISYTKKTSYDEFTAPVSDNPDGFKITYICNNDEIVYSTSDSKGKAMNPGAPYKICADFNGWYSDSECTKLYDFSTKVTEDLTLYAGWTISYPDLSSTIYQETILANVMVKSQNYKQMGISIKKASSTSQGSGVIFYEDTNYYYLLTNNHVTAVSNGYTGSYYSIYDCYNNYYEGSLISMSADYDLAILKFSKDGMAKTLNALEIANYNPEKEDEIIAMGDPQGLINTISYGNVLGYKTYTPAASTLNLNNITFDVVMTDAYINSGSSGGALLDTNLKIAGIMFASAENAAGEFVRSYAVPASKLNEYIEANMK